MDPFDDTAAGIDIEVIMSGIEQPPKKRQRVSDDTESLTNDKSLPTPVVAIAKTTQHSGNEERTARDSVLTEDDEGVSVGGVSDMGEVDRVQQHDAVRPQDDPEGHYASMKKYTPAQVLLIPQAEAWKLNLEHRDVDPNQLEWPHVAHARRITWLVDYAREVGDPDYVFFRDGDERKGGPFAFLSNFYSSSFNVPTQTKAVEIDDLEDLNLDLPAQGLRFLTGEHWHQWARARFMQRAEFLCIGDITTKNLADKILQATTAHDARDLGHTFDEVEKDFDDWWAAWLPQWEAALPRILTKGLYCKFKDNLRFADWLLMTGNFELVKASRRDFRCGIGFHASVARKKGIKNWGDNHVGKALITARKLIRAERGIEDTEYQFKFWRLWEETCNAERLKSEGTRFEVEGGLEVGSMAWRRLKDREMGERRQAWNSAAEDQAVALDENES